MDPIEFEQDLRDVSDATLDALHGLVAAERGRRDNLRRIPEQIADLAEKYRHGGGDEQALTDALTPEQAALDT